MAKQKLLSLSGISRAQSPATTAAATTERTRGWDAPGKYQRSTAAKPNAHLSLSCQFREGASRRNFFKAAIIVNPPKKACACLYERGNTLSIYIN